MVEVCVPSSFSVDLCNHVVVDFVVDCFCGSTKLHSYRDANHTNSSVIFYVLYGSPELNEKP